MCDGYVVGVYVCVRLRFPFRPSDVRVGDGDEEGASKLPSYDFMKCCR